MESSYTAKDITVLEGIEAVRKRPGMYIGSTGSRGLHHLVYEVVDNSIDEALAGFCSKVEVFLHPDGSVTVRDDGRGIPVGKVEGLDISAVEVVLTRLHAGAKFGGRGYKVSGGLHGVGISVVNALSEWLEVEVKREGRLFKQRYERGEPVTPLEIVGEASTTGTIVRFKPDPEIFEELKFDAETIAQRLKEIAYLNRGLSLTLVDERSSPSTKQEFYFEGGIVDFVKDINTRREALHEKVIYFSAQEEGMELEVAMQYCADDMERVYAFANSINTQEGGTHLVGFRSALTRTINEYARNKGLLKEKEANLTGEDVREGLTAILSLRLIEPQFEGQTKTKLGNPEVRGFVESVTAARLAEFLEENPGDARAIINRAIMAARARLASRKARELVKRKGFLESTNLPGKLADCTTTHPEEAEIFIVEGDSAGGSAKQARNRNFQAILPLRGKILNVEKASLNKVLSSTELQTIVQALGAGIGEDFDLNGLRYHRVIIMTDADVDGAHIRTLILTFFYRNMKPLIESGYVYIAQPPLYRVRVGGKDHYIYSERDLEKFLKEAKGKKVEVQRFKGLGEMNPTQLWETTMNPEKRTLLQVTVEDAVRADEIFSILMGEKVSPRREFIEKHAKEVRFLDI
jgi:DNA gyrase subunit B